MSSSPFRPGNIYYMNVSYEGLYPNECRNNPDLGPRPWLIVYSRQHARTGTLLVVPLKSKGSREIPSQMPLCEDDFMPNYPLRREGFLHLEQMRCLDLERIDHDRGCVGQLSRMAIAKVRANLMGMLNPQHLPRG